MKLVHSGLVIASSRGEAEKRERGYVSCGKRERKGEAGSKKGRDGAREKNREPYGETKNTGWKIDRTTRVAYAPVRERRRKSFGYKIMPVRGWDRFRGKKNIMAAATVLETALSTAEIGKCRLKPTPRCKNDDKIILVDPVTSEPTFRRYKVAKYKFFLFLCFFPFSLLSLFFFFFLRFFVIYKFENTNLTNLNLRSSSSSSSLLYDSKSEFESSNLMNSRSLRKRRKFAHVCQLLFLLFLLPLFILFFFLIHEFENLR